MWKEVTLSLSGIWIGIETAAIFFDAWGIRSWKIPGSYGIGADKKFQVDYWS